MASIKELGKKAVHNYYKSFDFQTPASRTKNQYFLDGFEEGFKLAKRLAYRIVESNCDGDLDFALFKIDKLGEKGE